MFKKSISQHTFDRSQNLPKQKIFTCYMIGHLVRKYISSPMTCNTMKGILHWHNISNEKSRQYNSCLQGIVLKIQNYKMNTEKKKLNYYVTKLKRLASIHGTTKSLNMHYSTLYRLLQEASGYTAVAI